MALEDRKQWVEYHRSIPTKGTENANGYVRGSQYGEVMVQSLSGKMHALADEGSYFVASNPTPGTGVAGHAAPTDVTLNTKPFMFMRNARTVSEDKRVYLDYIRLQSTVAGANASDLLFALKLDTGNTLYSSGGSAITPVNPNMASSAASSAAVYAGAVVASAATTSMRLIKAGLIRTVIPVVGDQFIFEFGAHQRSVSNMIVAGTAVGNYVIPCPPIVLGPADMFMLHLASTAQTAANSYQFEIGYWER